MKKFLNILNEFKFTIILCFIIVFVASPAIVQGQSMQNTVHDRDIVMLNKIPSYTKSFNRGEVIVFQATRTDRYIKRIIGLPNDNVNIFNGHVYVNGKLYNEKYLVSNDITYPNLSLKVPNDSLFVLGDNRTNSRDSRIIGCIKMNKVKGEAKCIIFPFGDIKMLKSK
ncbi:MAG: signal peptidase I [Clostridium sp.]|nr:signal peptidase I [Clostridium sp.]